MKRKLSDPALYLSVLLCLVPLVISAACYDRLPMLLATHWGAHNQPDRYSSVFFTAIVMPVLFLILDILVILALNADMTRRPTFYTTCCKFALPAASLFCSMVLVVRVLQPVTFLLSAPILVGMLLVIVAAHLPNCRRDLSRGILLPWTVSNERNWVMTHRVACGSTAAAGFLLIAAAFFWTLPLITVAAVVGIVTPVLFSFFYSRKRHS
jgi:uncharacterized membrane protein